MAKKNVAICLLSFVPNAEISFPFFPNTSCLFT